MRKFDITTIIGLLSALLLIYAAIYMGGNALGFIDLRSLFVVLLGTIAITAACFTWNDLRVLPKIIKRALTYKSMNVNELARATLKISQLARNGGFLALENHIHTIIKHRFFCKGISMLIDNLSTKEVQEIISADMNSMSERHNKSAEIIKKAGETAPSMGLIGTLIGLVQMLGNLDDPSSIGPSMAVALLTTLYGAIIAFVICSPIITKLESIAKEERLAAEISLYALVSIGKAENPRQLEILLNSILPPDNQVRYFD